MANLSEEINDDINNDERDPVRDEALEHLDRLEEQAALAYLRRLGYVIRKVTQYDR
jgi:hypothetical protein